MLSLCSVLRIIENYYVFRYFFYLEVGCMLFFGFIFGWGGVEGVKGGVRIMIVCIYLFLDDLYVEYRILVYMCVSLERILFCDFCLRR